MGDRVRRMLLKSDRLGGDRGHFLRAFRLDLHLEFNILRILLLLLLWLLSLWWRALIITGALLIMRR